MPDRSRTAKANPVRGGNVAVACVYIQQRSSLRVQGCRIERLLDEYQFAQWQDLPHQSTARIGFIPDAVIKATFLLGGVGSANFADTRALSRGDTRLGRHTSYSTKRVNRI